MKRTKFTSVFLLAVVLAVTVNLVVPKTANATYKYNGLQNYIEVYYTGYLYYSDSSIVTPTTSTLYWVGEGYRNNAMHVAMVQGVANYFQYGCGTTDGFWGPNTKAGLIRYQNNNYEINTVSGLPTTVKLVGDGYCGTKTLNSMGYKIGGKKVNFSNVKVGF